MTNEAMCSLGWRMIERHDDPQVGGWQQAACKRCALGASKHLTSRI
jgi:hypothetical protein